MKFYKSLLCITNSAVIAGLTRVRYGNITLPRYLSAGKSEELSPYDVNALRQSVKMKRFYFPKSLLDKLDRKR